MGVRDRVWWMVEAGRDRDRLSRSFDVLIIALIVLNVLAVVLESVQSLADHYAGLFWGFEVFSVAVFTLEYLARLWACTTEARYAHPLRGRLRFALRPMLLVDLLAIAPFYLPLLGLDLRVVRALRILRILRVMKLGRYYSAFHLMGRVIRHRKEELTLSLAVLLILLLLSSTLMYHFEHEAQPQNFPNIPATMWWSVVTLTTVGYGDVYPVTIAGKLFAAAIAILGVGMVALPAGILGSGFVEEVQRPRAPRLCPHCGKPLSQEVTHDS